jgi:hypothetical protein
LLHNCLLSNRLNELVYAKHQHRTSGYWCMFQDKKLDLSDPFPTGCLPRDQWMEIYDDDHCPHCNAPGYLTKRKEICSQRASSCLDALSVQLHNSKNDRKKMIRIISYG